jgi:hypothetical protein
MRFSTTGDTGLRVARGPRYHPCDCQRLHKHSPCLQNLTATNLGDIPYSIENCTHPTWPRICCRAQRFTGASHCKPLFAVQCCMGGSGAMRARPRCCSRTNTRGTKDLEAYRWGFGYGENRGACKLVHPHQSRIGEMRSLGASRICDRRPRPSYTPSRQLADEGGAEAASDNRGELSVIQKVCVFFSTVAFNFAPAFWDQRPTSRGSGM